MNAEDKKILELLNENHAVKAPENFTTNVMDAIAEYEESKNPIIQLNSFIFMLTAFAIASSIGIFYYFDNSIFTNITSYFTVISDIVLNQYAWFNNSFEVLITAISANNILIIIALGFVALLGFDRIFLKKRMSLNIFTIV
jgi:hypothetical protein